MRALKEDPPPNHHQLDSEPGVITRAFCFQKERKLLSKRILKISAIAPVVLLCGCGSLLPFAGLSSQLGLAAVIVIVLVGLLFAVTDKIGLPKLKALLPDQRFNEEHITHTFIAAIPTLTREMNLEVAISKQTEVLEKNESRKMFGVDLGTNTARISVPVTYRYRYQMGRRRRR